MSDVSSLTQKELTALAKAVGLYEELVAALGEVEAYPRNHLLHIETEVPPGYLGWIGYDESGTITFQPASPEVLDA